MKSRFLLSALAFLLFAAPAAHPGLAPSIPAGVPRIISTTVAPGGASSVTITVPAGFTNFTLEGQMRSDRASNESEHIKLQFNSDTAANYDWEKITGYSTAAPSVEQSTTGTDTYIDFGEIPAATATANSAAAITIDVPNYAGTTFYKSVLARSQGRYVTHPEVHVTTGTWKSASAINGVTVFLSNGNIVAGSTFTLKME